MPVLEVNSSWCYARLLHPRNQAYLESAGSHKDNSLATWHIFPASTIEDLQPHAYGDLPHAVVGLKRGKLQVLLMEEDLHSCEAPLNFRMTHFADSVREAAKHRTLIPKRRKRHLRQVDKWLSFNAWQCGHKWAGNTMMLRHHVCFRLMREVPTGANIIRKGKKKNFVDHKNNAHDEE